MTKRRIGLPLACLAAAFVLLFFASQCSPLYPINVWDDANCLLTVGRIMRAGGVLYRDIYEQKGPTLYLIETLGAWISDTSFFGVYMMEAASFGAMLFAAVCLLRKRLGEAPALGAAILMGACVLVGRSFSRGNSAEEFCLPFLMGALLLAQESYAENRPMPTLRLFACGLMAGCVATIKYTILGLFVGLCLTEGIAALREGGFVRALRSAGVFLSGMLLPVALWAAYFAANGALGDAYTAYIYNNIFLYSAEEGAGELVRTFVRAMLDNAIWALPCALGVAAFCLDRREAPLARLGALLMTLCTVLAVFLLGRAWSYCPLILSVFSVYVVMELPRLPLPRMTGRMKRIVAGGCCALALGIVVWLSPNAYLRGVKLEELAQGRLSKFLSPGDTLLQYSHLDDGLYLATGALPQEKYFVRLNVALDEMNEELDRYLREGIPQYVLSSWEPLPEEFDGIYQLIATDAGYDDRDRINKMLYLYRRR